MVTGANRGIGLEIARQYALEGWKVLACCRDPENANELAGIAAQSKGAAGIHRVDVTDAKRIKELARELSRETIDILFNNAGTRGPEEQGFGHVDEDGWLETIKVNTMAPLKMAEAFVNHVSRSRRGVIASMSSIMGSIALNSTGGYYAYRTSKAALNIIVKGLAADLRGKNIISVCFHPGWVKTRMGGAFAMISAEESVAGIRRVLSGLTGEDSGKFFSYEGEEIPW